MTFSSGATPGYDWYGTRVRLVRRKGATGTAQGREWYGARVRLVRRKGATGTAQGCDWYGARYDWRCARVRCKGATGTPQGYESAWRNGTSGAARWLTWRGAAV